MTVALENMLLVVSQSNAHCRPNLKRVQNAQGRTRFESEPEPPPSSSVLPESQTKTTWTKHNCYQIIPYYLVLLQTAGRSTELPATRDC